MVACSADRPAVGSDATGHGPRVVRVKLDECRMVVPFEHLGIDSLSEEYDIIACVSGYFDSTYEHFSEHTLVRNPDGSIELLRTPPAGR